MLSMDMKTTVSIYVLINYICTFMLALTWFENKNRFNGLSFMLFDFLFQSIGMTLAVFYGAIPSFFSIALANILMFSGAMLFLFGMALFLESNINRKFYYAYLFIFSCLYIFSIYSQPFFRIRVMIFNGMILPVFLHIVYLIFNTSSLDNRKHAYNTGFVFILFSLLTFYRFYYAATENNLINYFDSSKMDNLLVILSMLCTVLLTFSLQMMINKKLYAQVELLANTDSLTKIYNRRKIEDVIHYEINRNSRYNGTFCILLADIDHFKHFNDTYGHDVGDKALIHVTDLISSNLRTSDTVGRWGGEEFLIVLPNTNIHNAAITAERLVKSIYQNTLAINEEQIGISISVGATEFVETSTFESLIKNADEALYSAKENGRNRYEISGVTIYV